MAKRKLDNLIFIVDGDFDKPFTVLGYTFYPQSNQKCNTGKISVADNNKHKQNAYVEFKSRQKQSVIFRGGQVGMDIQRSRDRKILEDLLVIGSILTGRNWNFFSRRNWSQYPVVSRCHLECISKDAEQCKTHLDIAISKLQDNAWQKQFENGFHLVMLLNHANILNQESRFIAMVVIWEWLYAHLANKEPENLHQIIAFILKKFWPKQINESIFTDGKINRISKNIFYVLRNQLVHSGRLPIDRSYAEKWMKDIERDDNKYLRFFDHLTQIVVLKTLGIGGESSLKVFSFQEKLDKFLQTGKIN